MNHLTPDELVDAVEETLGADRRAHLTSCGACGEEVARLAMALGGARDAGIPEPSPLFWDHFSRRVREAIAAEDAPRGSWAPRWLHWPVLAPMGALALVVIALGVAVSRTPVVPSPERAAVSIVAVDDLAMLGENEWAVVEEIVGPVDLEDARDAGIVVKPGDVERAALELTDAEQRELVRLLTAEMDRSGG